jgi:hypothetical protein
MVDNNLPFYIKMYNERVQAMNQSNGKLLTLNAQEARSLHSEIYNLMATIANLTTQLNSSPVVTTVSMDGGSFK